MKLDHPLVTLALLGVTLLAVAVLVPLLSFARVLVWLLGLGMIGLSFAHWAIKLTPPVDRDPERSTQ